MTGKRYKYSLTNKNHAAKGVVSTACAGISFGFSAWLLCALWLITATEAYIWELWVWLPWEFPYMDLSWD